MRLGISLLLAAFTAAQYEKSDDRSCKITWENWHDSSAWLFKTGDEDNKIDTLVTNRIKDDEWLFNYKDEGKMYLKEKGNQLFDKRGRHQGTLEENGDIVWKKGYTTRLMNPCPKVKECMSDWAALVSAKGVGRTWRRSDAARVSTDYFKLEQDDDGKICFKNKNAPRACYIPDGIKLTHESDPTITGTVQQNGDIWWSNGLTSRHKNSPCKTCKMSANDMTKARFETFRMTEPEKILFDF